MLDGAKRHGGGETASDGASTGHDRCTGWRAMKASIRTLVLLPFAAYACALRPAPVASRVGSAEAAVRSARDAAANRVPDAAVHLRLAQEELGRARRFIDNGEYERAEGLLARAEADANLAVALTRAAEERAAAEVSLARLQNASRR